MKLNKTKTSTTTTTGPTITTLDGGPLGGSKSPYPVDSVLPMPNSNSAAAIEAARLRRAEILSKYGRTGTSLVSQSGTRPYVNSHLGGG